MVHQEWDAPAPEHKVGGLLRPDQGRNPHLVEGERGCAATECGGLQLALFTQVGIISTSAIDDPGGLTVTDEEELQGLISILVTAVDPAFSSTCFCSFS